METIEEKAKKFKILNDLAVKGENVAFGSNYLCDFPFYTLMQKRVTDYAVYNRSIEGLTVKDAINVVEDCLKNLNPESILISFGENEVLNDEFYSDYRALIAKIQRFHKNSKLCILQPRGSDITCEKRLKKIASEMKVKFIPVTDETETDRAVFGEMSSFFRRGKISFLDAFAV